MFDDLQKQELNTASQWLNAGADKVLAFTGSTPTSVVGQVAGTLALGAKLAAFFLAMTEDPIKVMRRAIDAGLAFDETERKFAARNGLDFAKFFSTK